MAIRISGGTVVDGSGSPGRRADVVVAGGKIVAVGADVSDVLAGVCEVEEYDASGMIVSPGFIDLHTHYDAQVLWDNTMSSSCWHGVTTVVGGNCGFSIAPVSPGNHESLVGLLHDLEDMSADTLRAGIDWGFSTFGEYLDHVERKRPWLNFGAFVGHSALRVEVLGTAAFEREASTEEIREMAELARDSLAAGAIGFATTASPSGRNCPTKWAGLSEVTALLAELGKAGRGIGSFVPGREITLEKLYELQPRIGRPFTYTALLAYDDGSHRERVNLHRTSTGAQVHPQVSCRRLVFQTRLDTGFALRAPSVLALDRATADERMARYRDPGWRDTCAAELAAIPKPPNWARWQTIESGRHPELVGRWINQVAAERGVRPLDVVLDTVLDDALTTRFEITLGNADETEVAALLHLDGAVLGLSDAGAHPDQVCDSVLPTDLLGGWVRDRGVLTHEQAVRKLTGEIADMLGLVDRGYVREGMYADLVVFDPQEIGPGPARRVHDFPAGGERLLADAPTGIAHVFVNGTPIVKDYHALASSDAHGPGHIIRGADLAALSR